MKYRLSLRDFPRAQAIFHCIPRLESQYSRSQLPLLANIFSYWLRELAIFCCISFVSWLNTGPYTPQEVHGPVLGQLYWTYIFSYCQFENSDVMMQQLFSVFHFQVIENGVSQVLGPGGLPHHSPVLVRSVEIVTNKGKLIIIPGHHQLLWK